MALSPATTWAEGEVLTATALNAEFSRIYTDNGTAFANPATANRDMDGRSIFLDADGDTLIKASTDDKFELVVGGISLFVVDANSITAHNGIEIQTAADGTPPAIQATGSSDGNVDINLVPKGTGVVAIDGALFATHTDAVLANQVFGS